MRLGSKKWFSSGGDAVGRPIVIASGVIVILASVIMWWDLIRDGATLSDSLVPALFTVVGVFWLLVGFRAVRQRD